MEVDDIILFQPVRRGKDQVRKFRRRRHEEVRYHCKLNAVAQGLYDDISPCCRDDRIGADQPRGYWAIRNSGVTSLPKTGLMAAGNKGKSPGPDHAGFLFRREELIPQYRAVHKR